MLFKYELKYDPESAAKVNEIDDELKRLLGDRTDINEMVNEVASWRDKNIHQQRSPKGDSLSLDQGNGVLRKAAIRDDRLVDDNPLEGPLVQPTR